MPTVLIKESTIDAIMYTLEEQGCKLEYACRAASWSMRWTSIRWFGINYTGLHRPPCAPHWGFSCCPFLQFML